jgi:serine protease
LVRVLQGYDFISEDPSSEPDPYFTANDSNGRDDDPSDPGDWVPADECEDGAPAENSSWHGTRLAGILVAETNNGSGIAGIDQQAWLLPVRALGRCGGYISDIADAIRWAAGLSVPGVPVNSTPADVINLSLGAGGACSNTEQQAIDAAVASNTVVVVAAGNEGTLISESAPANCENIIVVTATTRQGAETCYTNIGEGADLAAPGGNSNDTNQGCTALPGDEIFLISNAGTDAPDPGEDFFGSGAGTSFSAAMVTGAVALMKSVNGSLSPATIESLLKTTTRPFPAGATDGFRPCTPDNCGTGILDLQAAIIAARDAGSDTSPAPVINNSGSGGGGSSFWLPVLFGLSLLLKTCLGQKRS